MRKSFNKLVGLMVAAMSLWLVPANGWAIGTPKGFTVDFSSAAFSSVSGNALQLQTREVAVSVANSSGKTYFDVLWEFRYADNKFHILRATNSTTGTTTSSGSGASNTPNTFTIDFSNAAFSGASWNPLRIQIQGIAVSFSGSSGQISYDAFWEFSYTDNALHISRATNGQKGLLPDTGQTKGYTNVFGEDSDYTTHPPSYTDNGNGTVTDNVTTLVWQKQDDGKTRTWDEALSYCDSLTLAESSDWRLPSITELEGIVDSGATNPAMSTTYFPIIHLSYYYWSSTAYGNSPAGAWNIYLYNGYVGNSNKSYKYYARCVRGGK